VLGDLRVEALYQVLAEGDLRVEALYQVLAEDQLW
jgi:hypothetical protein